MKVLAINLPAYHQIPENDKWWGEGFTEWDNVKNGKPLFSGHYQPIKPLHNNYYNLTNLNDLKKQRTLAKKYGIYGFIYYHYWFGEGRQLFEKPLEMIKDQIQDDFPYCLCWANETWKTTWHGLEPKTLIEQKYPGFEDWKSHYNYLREYFKDSRYIKIDNKPILFIYKPNEIPKYDQMIECLNEWAISDGFDGVYIIEYISAKNKMLHSSKSDAVFEFEPLYTTFFDISKINLFKRFLCKKFKMTDYQPFDKLWKYINKRTRTYKGKTIFKGCFSGWDNSARKGKESMVVKGKTPEKFEKYFREFVTRNRKDASTEFCVINAWNEWSEGAYLEPDSRDKYKYLEIIKEIITNEK